jgi:transposase
MHGPLQQFDRILALDLGKFNSVLCLYDPQTSQHRFVSLQTTPQAIHDLLVSAMTLEASRTLVVFETCDAAGWVHDLASALGLSVAVANPSHEAWRWTKLKRKTDKDDALKLAKLAARHELPLVHMPSPQQRQKRRLVHHRRSLIERQTQVKNQIRSIFSQQGLPLPQGKTLWTKLGIVQLKQQAKPIRRCGIEELWRGRLHVELELLEAVAEQIEIVNKKLDQLAQSEERVMRLQSVPGVGPRLAEAVVAHLDDPQRFKNARQVSAYAGLVPKQMESGTMKRVGRITRRGPALLRGMLVEVAWMVHRHNAWAKHFVDRVSRGMKARRRVAIVALARKLLVMLWAMLRDGTSWRGAGAGQGAGAEALIPSLGLAAGG